MNKPSNDLTHDTELERLLEETRMTDQALDDYIAYYETLHGFSSDELLKMVEAGNAPDTYEIGDWLNLLEIKAYHSQK